MTDFKPSDLKCEFKDFIAIYENAFTKSECQKTIELFELYHENNYTYTRENVLIKKDLSAQVYPEINLDGNTEFIDSYHDRFYNYLYPFYNHKYAILQTFPKHRSRYIKIQKTLPTQGYHIWHCENDDADARLLAWILYLNDVEEGGETEFLYQSLRVKPKAGTFILFPAYFTHTHRGNPPLSGSKYIATGWIELMCTKEVQGQSVLPDLESNLEPTNKIKYS